MRQDGELAKALPSGSSDGSGTCTRRLAPMRLRPFLAGLAVAGLLGAVPPARAADTVRLGGVGSMTAARTTDTPTMTLKGLPDDDATFENAHLVRRFAYGVARAATHPFGGYFRPYYHGYGFYRPWFYRPWSFGYSWP